MSTSFPVRYNHDRKAYHDFDSIFNDFFKGSPMTLSRRSTATGHMKANVRRTDEGCSISIVAPGMSRDDFSVNVDDGILTVSGKSSSQEDFSSDSYLRKEYSVGSFSRSWTLPEGTRSEAILARYESGILNLDVPIEDDTVPTIAIEVQ
jgi:HSP20 family protein